MVAAAKAAFDLHNPNKLLIVGEYEVQHRTSPHWLLCYCEEEVINELQEPSRLLLSWCVVSPRDIRMSRWEAGME